MKKIAIIVSGLLVLGLGIFFLTNRTVGATLPVAGQTYTLAGSGTTGSATSITLSSLTIPQTGYKLQDSDFSDTFYITFEPGSRQRQEIASCTTVTQNANNTATLSGCTRGLLPFTPFTASSSYQFAHGGGTSVIFSDPPQLFNQFLAADNTSTITGLYTFTQLPLGPTSSLTNDQQFVTAYQLQQVTSTGAVNGSEAVAGKFEGATQAEMSAGTEFGTTGASLTLLSKYATSSIAVSGRYLVVTRNSDGKIDASFGGGATSIATLDANSKVVQNPASATTTPAANSIPLSNASGTIRQTWIATSTTSTPQQVLKSAPSGAFWGSLGDIGSVGNTTSSRAIDGTVYQNTSSVARLVIVSIAHFTASPSAASAASSTVFVSNTSTPSIVAAQQKWNDTPGTCTGCTLVDSVVFIVPAGHYYRITSAVSGSGATITLNNWYEMDF